MMAPERHRRRAAAHGGGWGVGRLGSGAGHVGVSAATTTPAATPSASSRPTTTGAPAVAGGRRDRNGPLHDRGMDLAVIGKGPRRRERVLKRAGRLLSRVEGRTVVRRHRMGLAVGI